jgi:hypothetical protein
MIEKDMKISINIGGLKTMYDENGKSIDNQDLEKMFYEKIKDIIKEYIESGGMEIDFLNSEFGVDEAEGLEFYGSISCKVY